MLIYLYFKNIDQLRIYWSGNSLKLLKNIGMIKFLEENYLFMKINI